MKRVFIIEDEIIVAKGIEKILDQNGYVVVGIATNYKQAHTKLQVLEVDLILCDININSEKSGIDLMEEVRMACNAPFIFISAYTDFHTISNADRLSPANYITKPFNDQQLLTSVQRVFIEPGTPASPELPTDRELSIIKLVAHGLSNKEIADVLNISHNTVETHRRNLIKKYHVKTTAELVCLAMSNNWIEYYKNDSKSKTITAHDS